MQPSGGKYQKPQHRRQREHSRGPGSTPRLCWSWLYLSGSVGFDDVFSFSVRRKCQFVLVKVWSNSFLFSRRKFHVTSSTLHILNWIGFQTWTKLWIWSFFQTMTENVDVFSPFFPFLSVDKSVWFYCNYIYIVIISKIMMTNFTRQHEHCSGGNVPQTYPFNTNESKWVWTLSQ